MLAHSDWDHCLVQSKNDWKQYRAMCHRVSHNKILWKTKYWWYTFKTAHSPPPPMPSCWTWSPASDVNQLPTCTPYMGQDTSSLWSPCCQGSVWWHSQHHTSRHHKHCLSMVWDFLSNHHSTSHHRIPSLLPQLAGCQLCGVLVLLVKGGWLWCLWRYMVNVMQSA